MAYVNVAEWNPDHVVDWLRGLEDEIQPYTQFFVNNKVNGCQLLTLARDDLANLNMTKIGHQELVLDAVEQLRQLHYNLTSETLQSLALKLGCKAQSLFNDLKRVCYDFATTGKKERVSVDTLSAVADIINLVKSLISWLDRYPFAGQEIYSDVRKTILKLCVELASTAQRDQFADNPNGIIKDTCSKLAVQSDKIVQDFNDSLIIQPASLEVAKVKRKAEDDVGIHINSLFNGIHIIESIKYQSPAYRSGKIEEGDEIVQVNYQTVVGWQVKNIICAMKEHPSEVHLTLKKRPRHPNVLGQVVCLWPYRIPSKKTAFRKLYKWNKGKDIRDLCQKSPGIRCETNSVSEMNGGLASEKEKLLAVNKPRNRLRRRATVTGVSPTTLQAPVSLEELIGSNSKRKESVLRTISYDPNKTIDLEDNVFKRDTLSCGTEDKEDIPPEDLNATVEPQKSTFLRPPQEKFMTSHLRRQEALKNSETVARAAVAVPSLQSQPPAVDSRQTQKSPLRISTQPTMSESNVQEPPPSGSQSPRQKFSDWVNRQKKKPEGLLQHALTLFSPDASSEPCSSPKGGSGSPKSPKCNGGSPKSRKSSSTMFPFPFREGRPSLSELRGLKKTANSKAFSERVNSTQADKMVTSPKQNPINKRSQMQHKRSGLAVNHSNLQKSSKPHPEHIRENTPSKPSTITDSYIHPRNINYARIPQYPCEMHESKIVSLKSKGNSQLPTRQLPPQQPSRNNLHYQRLRQMSKLAAQGGASTLLKNQKYPAAFCSPSGRSLSFNNIAMSSDDDSSSEDYDIYEEVPGEPGFPTQSNPNGQSQYLNGMDPVFARQLAEMYNMITQRQQFLQRNGGHKNASSANSAVIDELALRMYHALQMTHMQQSQIASHQKGTLPHPPVPPKGMMSVPRNGTHLSVHPMHKIPEYSDPYAQGKSVASSVREHPVDLPPSGCLPSRNGHVFKSATSQEIHNLYTSNKSGMNASPEHDKIEKEHMYETIPCQKSKRCNSMLPEKSERSNICPAEKEFECDAPCSDNSKIMYPRSNRLIQENMFIPIKESTPLGSSNFSVFQPASEANQNKKFQKPNKYDKRCDDQHMKDLRNTFGDCIQPALSTLMMNIPKPPAGSFPTAKKTSSSQTDSDICDSALEESQPEDKSVVPTDMCLTDDSFTTALNYLNNSISDSLGYSSNSSLNSSSSGSTISSSGSCYYYVETQVKPQFTVKFPSVTSETDDAPLIDLRSPTLPTMGVSMLGKKRSPSCSGSEHGSNAGSRASPNFPIIVEVDPLKSHRIVTDVEHTF